MRDRPVRSEGKPDVLPFGAKDVHIALQEGIKEKDSWESAVQNVLGSSAEWIAAQCRAVQSPALTVNLGFQDVAGLLQGHRLQDYAVVIADGIKELCGVQFLSLRLVKQQGNSTTVAVGEAVDAGQRWGSRSITLETRRSYATSAFSDEIGDHTASLKGVLVPNTPLELHVSYVTGLPRTWSRLWKPTLSGVFANRVDTSQVVDLLFDHRSVGDELGHRVRMSISVRRASVRGQRSKETKQGRNG